MSDRVCFAWLNGPDAGRVQEARLVANRSVQNTLAFIGWVRHDDLKAHAEQLGIRLPKGPFIRCGCEWFPSTLCPAPLAQGNVERYPWFCPVWDRDTLIAVLLKEGE